MTDLSPPPPRDRQVLSFDEFVAVGVALIGMGFIVFWGLTRGDQSVTNQLSRLVGPDSEASQTLNGRSSEAAGAGEGNLNSAEQEAADEQDSANPMLFFGDRFSPNQPSSLTLESLSASLGDEIQGAIAVSPNAGVSDSDNGLSNILSEAESATEPSDESEAGPTDLPELPPAATQSAPPGPAVDFSDVPEGYWASDAIDTLSARRLMAGYEDGTFQPDAALSRAEFAALLAAIFPDQNRQSAIAFIDVADDFWASNPIQTAVQSGFIKGLPDGDFQPARPMSRAQVLAALTSGLSLTLPSDAASVVNRYEDAADIPAWAVPSVAAATEANLVVNYPDLSRLNPNRPVTRAEAAAILNQALVYSGRIEGSPSEYVVQ